AISLLVGSQGAFALTPWTDGVADLVIYTSGGAAQDQAISKVVSTALAASGSLDTFSDTTSATSTTIGGRWQAFYFTGKSDLGTGLAGKKIILVKRSYGAAGYGVVPLFANNGEGLALENLNIEGTQATDWEVDGTAGKKWKAVINQASANKFLKKVVSDGGFLGVDPAILLQPGTENYPEQVNEISTGQPEANWPDTLNATPEGFTLVSTGGLVYGVAVTQDLYKVLQVAQKRAGSLPSTVTVGHYSDPAIPNLSRNLLASILAGKIASWEQVKIVDKDTKTAVALTDQSILTEAGVAAPFKNVDGKSPVGVGRRNKGAAIGAVAYAKFLNYPGTANANKPAGNTASAEDDVAAPVVKSPGGAGATDNLLIDWNNGTNVSGLNSKSLKIWGVAVNSGDRNPGTTADGATPGKPWRYVKIDGFAPTIENVAAGVYPHWAEGVVLYRTSKSTDPQWADKSKLLKTFADNLGSPTIAKDVNSTLPYGVTGIFATTKDPRGFQAKIPFEATNPVVPLTHFCTATDSTLTGIVPVADDKATGGLEIQLK
ncbi:MAG: hypothetical protein ABL919_11710, partial [Methylococcales bacterium]